jgi:acyl-coenzyme A synthetase/AMP-(fatty) acid ligase
VVFDELPKTSTGKIQKFKLREMAKTAGGQTTDDGGRKKEIA